MVSGQDGKTGFRRGVASNRRGRGGSALLAVPLVLSATIVSSPAARAEQYWVAYEGEHLPETVGWTRWFGNENGFGMGGASRSLGDGLLTLDSLRHDQIFDYYEVERQIDPAHSELFIATWRVRIVENHGSIGDTVVGIFPDGGGTLSLLHYADGIESSREGWFEPVAPDEFHTYRVESANMISYSLWIDDEFIRFGEWDLFSLNMSRFAFGDGVQGARSLGEWDYVRFGVIPEPAAWITLSVGIIVWGRHAWRR